MEIGQKVRFLNEVGGGVIAGFQGKNIVLIEDADGFEIPMLRSQVVVIETSANNFERPNPGRSSNIPPQPSTPLSHEDGAGGEATTVSVAKATERKGGDLLNVMLAFIPENVRELTSTRFESYLINDSNYYLSVFVAAAEGAAWHLRWQQTIEPNTKLLIETIDREQLNDIERLAVHIIAWKQDKPFMLKAPAGIELRLDLVKFYKLHVFQASPFFREPALIYDLVRDDRPVRKVFSAAEDMVDEVVSQQLETTYNEPEPTENPSNEPEPMPVRTREQEREALKAAKRALKAEQNLERARQYASTLSHGKDSWGEAIEVDLHISALLDNTAGLSDNVLLNTQLTEFRIIMERYKAKKGQRIVFIHGKGENLLHDAIVKELQHRYRSCTYQDASSREHGNGAIMVTIR